MAEAAQDAEEIILLRHVPGGSHFQGKPPLRITSENFKLRTDRETGELESGISVSKSACDDLFPNAIRVLELRRTGPDSRIGYAYKRAVETAGFVVQDDPTTEDASHCVIKSATTRLEEHSGRKQLALIFCWVKFPDDGRPQVQPRQQ